MRRFVATLGLIPMFAVASLSAQAADMAVKAQAPLPAPLFSWTGFYVGVSGGYTWADANTSRNQIGAVYPGAAVNAAAVNAAGTGRLDLSGGIVGGTAGYNWQTGSMVLGVETDFSGNWLKTSSTVTQPYPAFAATFSVARAIQTDWLYTLRGRLGFTVTPQLLIYGTGGLAVTEIRYSTTFTDNAGFGAFDNFATRTTRAGWTVGGGLEYAFAANWSAKAEYLYSDFGSLSGTSTFALLGLLPTYAHSVSHLRENTARVGLNYRFGGPVVARY